MKTGVHWRILPHDLPPWPVVYQQMRRWMADEQDRAQVADLVAQIQTVTSLPDTFGMGEESRPSAAMARGA